MAGPKSRDVEVPSLAEQGRAARKLPEKLRLLGLAHGIVLVVRDSLTTLEVESARWKPLKEMGHLWNCSSLLLSLQETRSSDLDALNDTRYALVSKRLSD